MKTRDKTLGGEELKAEGLSSDREKTISTRTIAVAGKPEPEQAKIVEDSASEPELSPLFSDEADRDFRAKWHDIQTGFVDEPRRAVERADELVAQLMQRLAQSFSDQRNSLERQWEQSEEVSTEDLRLALRRYRSFFERLLAI
jgi:hypothetical protein